VAGEIEEESPRGEGGVGGGDKEQERERVQIEGEGKIKYLQWRTYHRRVIIGSNGDNTSSPPVRGWNCQ
jgi:hypothetical protein